MREFSQFINSEFEPESTKFIIRNMTAMQSFRILFRLLTEPR